VTGSKRTLLLAWSSVALGASVEEFHAWYESVHVPQVCAALSVEAPVERFTTSGPNGSQRFLAIYALGDLTPAAAGGLLREAAMSGNLDTTDLMDSTDHPPEIQFVVSL
jgi:hypothetical protein